MSASVTVARGLKSVRASEGESSQARDQTCVPALAGGFFHHQGSSAALKAGETGKAETQNRSSGEGPCRTGNRGVENHLVLAGWCCCV